MKLRPHHYEAARLLALGTSQRQAARSIGMSSASITHWMKRPEFVALVEAAREKVAPTEPESDELDPEWRAAAQEDIAAGARDSVRYLRRAVASDAPMSPHGIKAAQILMKQGNVAALTPEVETGPETDEEVVLLLWTCKEHQLRAGLALKLENRWREPTADEVAAALAHAHAVH